MVRRIFLVDDDPEFAEACRNFLEAAGYEVACETDDAQAFARIKEFAPDVVLLDIVMGAALSGFEIARQMRDDPALSRIPVIFLTGYFQRADSTVSAEQALSQWPNVKYILDKPVKPSLLLSLIQKLAQEAGGGVQ